MSAVVRGHETNENILVIDDEKELADLVGVYLKNDGCNVYRCYSGTDALKCIETVGLDLVILDIMFPDIGGFQICQKIREEFYFPVIMLTTEVEDGDKIMGLSVADDYIMKPLNPLGVVARAKAQLRQYIRYKQPCIKQEAERMEYDIRGMIISKSNHECILFGEETQLTPAEFSILWYLYERQGTVVSTGELSEAVWGERYLDGNNTMMAHTGRFREKTKEPSRNSKSVKTVQGVGYTIEKQKYDQS